MFSLPGVLMYSGIIPLLWRFHVWSLGLAMIVVIVTAQRWSLSSLGIRVDNLRECWRPYLLFTLAGILTIIVIAEALGRSPRLLPWTDPYFRVVLFPLCALQEFVFRGYLLPRLKAVCSSSTLVVLWSAFLFSVVHIIYPDPQIILPMLFAGGIGFAAIYNRYPNLLLVTLSHVALNLTVVMYCFVSFGCDCG